MVAGRVRRMVTLFSGIAAPEAAVLSDPALARAVELVGYSEVDKHALALLRARFPRAQDLGDVTALARLPAGVDLLVGGSPCQNLSKANNVRAGSGANARTGLAGAKSSLFYEYARLAAQLPRDGLFVFENVHSMPSEAQAEITRALGAVCAAQGTALHQTVLCNSSFLPMRRKRRFWTNFPVAEAGERRVPHVAALTVARVTPADAARFPTLLWDRARVETYMAGEWDGRARWDKGFHLDLRTDRAVANCFTAAGAFGLPYNLVVQADGTPRRWLPEELEGLHGFPRGWTEPMGAYNARVRGLGNTMSVPCLRHILRCALGL